MKDEDCVQFLQQVLPQLQMRWPGFRKVRRQVCRRIDRRISELGLAHVAAYQNWIVEHPEELQVIDGFCKITISRFYRDRGIFDLLRTKVLPELAQKAQAKAQPTVRCWSAGCASGEEPYTVNMIWKLAVAALAPSVVLKIMATDIDPRMLQRAERGCYSHSSLKDFPKEWMDGCFTRVEQEYCVNPEYRSGIQWRRQDIREDMPDEIFDVILCRHLVLTYFDEPLQLRILRQLVSSLSTEGILVTGKQESLPKIVPGLVQYSPRMGVYRRL